MELLFPERLNVDGTDVVKKAGIQSRHVKNYDIKADMSIFHARVLWNEVMSSSELMDFVSVFYERIELTEINVS